MKYKCWCWFVPVQLRKADRRTKYNFLKILEQKRIFVPESLKMELHFYGWRFIILRKRLFPYIPFYIARYEEAIASEGAVNQVVDDLIYFRDEMIRLQGENELSDYEVTDLMGFVNTIITHITNGNKNEERLVNIMGGTVIETESEKVAKRSKAQMIIEMGQEFGLDDTAILARLQEKIGVSLEKAKAYLAEYGKQLV